MLAALTFRAKVDLAARAGVGLVAFLALCSLVGLINLNAYGKFTINEVKGSDFQSALGALQRASYLHRKPYLPVPEEARMEIYRESPSFAKLRPYLDPEVDTAPWWVASCELYKTTCGDIASGWFVWALRDAASRFGIHTDAAVAAKFYRSMAEEIEVACEHGRLTCGGCDQALSLPGRMMKAASFITMRPPMSFAPLRSDIDEDTRLAVMALLNEPIQVEKTTTRFLLEGWYKGNGEEWIGTASLGASWIDLNRIASPDSGG
jgi:hypothetical protein